MRLIKSFVSRLARGQLWRPLYLTYYHLYILTLEMRWGKKFRYTLSSGELGHPEGMNGCFPTHPRVVKRLLFASGLPKEAPLLDVGCGTGLALFTARRLGYENLHGIELGALPFEDATRNIGNLATLSCGNALGVDLSKYTAIFFFNPFQGEPAKKFFENPPKNIRCVITMHTDPELVAILKSKGFHVTYQYTHRFYSNFSGMVWKRRDDA